MSNPGQPSPAPAPAFAFVGDALCLDLLNTVVQGCDQLADFGAFVRWLQEAGVLTAAEAQDSVRRWGAGAEGTAALRAAKSLRATLRAGVAAIIAGKPVPAATLHVLNPLLARSPARVELVLGEDGRPAKRFRLRVETPADLLAPVAESAADFLANADYALLRRCASPACTRVFLDRTKNHRRRWCAMAVCGNRAKVSAHRARRKPPVAS